MLGTEGTVKTQLTLKNTCKCGAPMGRATQAPSYCGTYFYSYCEESNWRNYKDHTESFEHNGKVEDFDITYQD